MDAEKYLEENLPVIKQAIKSLCAKYDVGGPELQDCTGRVLEKLIEEDYKKIRAYGGRSSFKTYITTVVRCLIIDIFRETEGRQRVSGSVKAQGKTAEILYKLIIRDGIPIDEATEILSKNYKISITTDEVYKLAETFSKKDRIKIDPIDSYSIDEIAPGNATPESVMEEQRLQTLYSKVMIAVQIITSQLLPEEILMINMRFQDNINVSEIARILKVERAAIDKGLKTIFVKLKEELLKRGISKSGIQEVFEYIERKGGDE
ncbi:MAG: sigma-70 family RNA polymerase sigma factor [Nitrospirae bacterium YQR-1]